MTEPGKAMAPGGDQDWQALVPLDALTAWMDINLRVQWVHVPEPWDIETEIVRLMRPPLNRTHNQEHPFYKEVGEARERFRAAALATVEPPS